MTTTFVEDCMILTPKDLLQGLQKRTDITYWPEDQNDQLIWTINVAGSEPQEVAMEWEQINFGERAYFRCACDHRSAKLYLPPGGTKFLCRRCHGLEYRLSSFNKNSVAGRAIYRMNRLQKLSDSRANMSRILYNGKFSKRFESFLRLCDRAGLDSIVNGANDLKALIQQ